MYNWYSIHYQGKLISKRPIRLNEVEYKKYLSDFNGTEMTLNLLAESDSIEFFTNLPTKVAEKLCINNNVNPSSVSIGEMVEICKPFI